MLLILIISSNQNFTHYNGEILNLEMGKKNKDKSLHPLAIPWALHYLLGVLGTFLNSFVLFLFVQERHGFVGAINVMIWYGTSLKGAIRVRLLKMKSFQDGFFVQNS